MLALSVLGREHVAKGASVRNGCLRILTEFCEAVVCSPERDTARAVKDRLAQAVVVRGGLEGGPL